MKRDIPEGWEKKAAETFRRVKYMDLGIHRTSSRYVAAKLHILSLISFIIRVFIV